MTLLRGERARRSAGRRARRAADGVERGGGRLAAEKRAGAGADARREQEAPVRSTRHPQEAWT